MFSPTIHYSFLFFCFFLIYQKEGHRTTELPDSITGLLTHAEGFPSGVMVKNPPANAGNIRDTGSIPGWGRSPGGGHGNPLQYSCLEKPIDRGAWQATVHRVAQSWTRLKRLSKTAAYDCLWNNAKEEIKILTPLFFITDSWLQALIFYKGLHSSQTGAQFSRLEPTMFPSLLAEN